MRVKTLIALLLVAIISPGLFAGQGGKGPIAVRDAWIREPNPARPIGAAFLTIRNDSDEANALVGASSPVAGVVEMHRMTDENGMMKMEKVDSIDLPAKRETRLEPGGYHLMLFDLKKRLRDGDSVALELRFRDGSTQTVTAIVKRPDA